MLLVVRVGVGLLNFLFYLLFVFQVLLLHVLEEVPENVMVVNYQFVYYSSVDVL